MGLGSRHASHFDCQPQREIGVTIYNYKTAVYVEDVQALTNELLSVIAKHAEHIPEEHMRNAVIGALLITAAQMLDGLPMPILWKRGASPA